MNKRRDAPEPAKPTALVRAEHHAAPLRLKAADKKILDEALRRGEDLREEVEAAVTGYGRWILDAVFGGEAAAALDGRTDNPVWLELVRRAGGPTLRINRRVLYVSVAVAANDKRITDQAWRGLDAARKELLLPLRASDRLRQAAHHVAALNLTQAKTREYVTSLLRGEGKARQVRLTSHGLVSRVRKLREGLAGAAVLRKVSELGPSLPAAERRRVLDEIGRLTQVLADVSRALQRKG